ncbi:hypothetical protein SAMD00023353_6800160 [Rosellinia necatrix]|uniref:Uncharacterized protein n=1 Tax=Rosellinia necatrix TaxID=77044 RepID=A0A1W2TWR1_ROSNE|nr:hypothetical protein SAMD00023353_6800160 [Rosellinia necatrix]
MSGLSQSLTPAQAYEVASTYATILRHVYTHPEFHYETPPTAAWSKPDLHRTPKGLFFTADFLQNTYVNNVLPFLPQGATRKCKALANPWAHADPEQRWEWTWDAGRGALTDTDGAAVPFPALPPARAREHATDIAMRNVFARKLVIENATDTRAQMLLGGGAFDFGEEARAAVARLD